MRSRILVAACVILGCDPAAPASSRTAETRPALSDGRVEVTTTLTRSVEPCLNQSVKDLGLGAKRAPDARRWAVGPEKLHAALVGKGEVHISATPGEGTVAVQVVAAWQGALEGEALTELEQRLAAVTARIGHFCGELGAPVECRSGATAALQRCAAR